MKKEYFKNVDFLRFIFTVMIAVLHLIHGSALPLHGAPNSAIYLDNTREMHCCVEFFFIISGFFFILTFKPQQTILDFMKSKFIRLWPVMAFTVVLFLIISFFHVTKFVAMDNIFALLFLNGMHVANHHTMNIGLGNIHSSWYVSVLFWISLLYFYLLKNFDKKFFNLFIPIIVILGLYWKSYNIPVCLEIGIIRGLYSIGLGCILGQLYVNYREKIRNIKLNLLQTILISLAELGIMGYLLFGLCFATKDRLVASDLILMFIALFALFIFNRGILSRFLNNNFSVFLGKISYSTFITHNLWLDILQKYYFQPGKLGAMLFSVEGGVRSLAIIALAVLICVIFGIFTYYFVEKPCVIYLKKKWFNKGG